MAGHYIAKINNKCNSNCCFCADSLEVRNQKDPDYNQLISDLEKNRKKFDSLIISGGEPTIYKNIFEYVKHAKNICRYKHITLTTNGFLLAYGDFVDKLIKNGVDSFIISFVTSNEKIYDRVTKVKGSFGYAAKALSNLRKRNREIRINTVLHKLNDKDIGGTVVFLINKGVASIQLSFMNPVGSSVKNGKSVLAVSYTELQPYIKAAFKKADEMNFNSLFIENFPICTAGEFTSKISDLRKPEENKDYYNACKAKPEKCRKCSYFDKCDGVWEEYLKQFGDKEISPIANAWIDRGKEPSDRMAEEYNFPKKFDGAYDLFAAYFGDIAGLEEGFKEASIFNIKQSKLGQTAALFKRMGYSCEVSDVGDTHLQDRRKAANGGLEKDNISALYVSKKARICKELKELERAMNFQKFSEDRISFNFNKKAGGLLGYPQCCIDFYCDIRTKQEYKEHWRMMGNNSDHERICRILSINRSKHKSYLLNNFNSCIPQMYSFVPCSYDCENAKKFVLKVIDYINNNNIRLGLIENSLHSPILSLSTHDCVVFEKAERRGDKIFYMKPKCNSSAKSLVSIFEKGDSFKISKDSIEIFKNDKIIHQINKSNEFNGLFLEFKH